MDPKLLKCDKCHDLIHDRDGIKCIKCLQEFHFYCVGFTESTFNKVLPMNRLKWRCLDCKTTTKTQRSPDRDRTQGTGMTQQLLATPDVAYSNSTASLAVTQTCSLDEVMQELKQLRNDIADIKKLKIDIVVLQDKFIDLEKAISFGDGKIDDFGQKLVQVETRLKLLDTIEQRVNILETNAQKQSLRDMEKDQWAKKKNIEIKGIPDTEKDLNDIIYKIAHYGGYALTPQDIDYVYRYRPRERDVTRPSASKIIVRLTSARRRTELLQSVHKRRATAPLTTSELGLVGTDAQVYVSEQISELNRGILKLAKEASKIHNWRFVWIKNGRIYARKTETSKICIIVNTSDVKKIIA